MYKCKLDFYAQTILRRFPAWSEAGLKRQNRSDAARPRTGTVRSRRAAKTPPFGVFARFRLIWIIQFL